MIDVFSRRIVGWRVLKHTQTYLVLDALEQALWQRGKSKGVIHHSDSSQYLSIRYTEKLAEMALIPQGVVWFNSQRLLQPIGDISPAEYEDHYYRQIESAQAA